MNKGELIAAVADKTGVSKKEAGEVLDAITETIIKSVSKGDDVQILGFGGFSVLERKARVGRNPSTGEQIKIKPTKTPKFKPGKAFKDAVNKKKKK